MATPTPFFTQAVSSALDRYAQRTMQKEQLGAQERMAAAELKEKYYYADIVKKSNDVQAETQRAELALRERAQGFAEDQAKVANELVPIQNFKGVPGMIMQGFSGDGRHVRRGDVPAMMQSYVGWLQATKLNQAESWRMGMYAKAQADESANRAALYELMGSNDGTNFAGMKAPETLLKEAGDYYYKGHKDQAYNGMAARALGAIPLAGNALRGAASDVAASFWTWQGGQADAVNADVQKQYGEAAGAFNDRLAGTVATLETFRKRNQEITPEMIGYLDHLTGEYKHAAPIMSRFAQAAINNEIRKNATKISNLTQTLLWPQNYKSYLDATRQRTSGEYRLEEQRLENEAKKR